MDTSVTVHSGDGDLRGDLAVPDATVAGVVLIGGSGPTERTNDGYFETYRRTFLAHGVAVTWYDKAGVGASEGDFLTHGIDGLATDAVAVVHRMRREVPDVPIGVFGHSEGGWVALRAAARCECVDFVVTNSTPGMSPAQQDRHAIAHAMESAGKPVAERAAVLALYDGMLRAAYTDRPLAHVRDLVAASPVAATLTSFLGEMDERHWTFWKFNAWYEPITDHRAIRCPHLAVFGAADPLVPVAESVAVYTASACEPTRDERATVTIHVVPDADHRLRHNGAHEPPAAHVGMLAEWIARAGDPDRDELP